MRVLCEWARFLKLHLFICTHVGGYAYVMMHVWKREDKLLELVLSFYQGGPRN